MLLLDRPPTGGSLVGGGVISGSLSRAAGENAGSYAILQGSVTAGGNYALSFVGASLTINKAVLTVTSNSSVNPRTSTWSRCPTMTTW